MTHVETTDHKKLALISINTASVQSHNPVLFQNTQLTVFKGDNIVLLGKSGAGKSTLLGLLFKQLTDKQQVFSWIPQELGLVENLSIFHNVYMGKLDQRSNAKNLLNLIWPQPTQKRIVHQWLKHFELNRPLFTPTAQLSGGQRQRVAIIRALYRQADILLADEPVANLDLPLAEKSLNTLVTRARTTVIALHDITSAMKIANRIIGIHNGKIVIDDAPNNICAHQLERLYCHSES